MGQNYRVSLAVWHHTMLPDTGYKRTHPVLIPASEGWYSIFLPRRDGRLSWPTWLDYADAQAGSLTP